ncbi:hypothetical protein RDABS01_001933, partial [Bienertia sinuspersici]
GGGGGEGIIRDHQGQFCNAFSANFGRCLAFRAEVRALGMGMEIAKRAGYTKLVVQMDNAVCVSRRKKVRLIIVGIVCIW